MEAFFANLPFVLLFLLCPLMMLFMHRGDHSGHAGHAQHHVEHRAELAPRVEAAKDDVKT